MRTVHHAIRAFTPLTAIIAALGLLPAVAAAVTVNAVWNSATDVPVTAYGDYATGRTVSFTLNFAPIPGTEYGDVERAAPEPESSEAIA